MSEQEYDFQVMTRYLLGSLPAAEVEHLDELSFTDENFAVALKAAEADLVDAYVQGELAAAPLEQFKSHYLASPLRRQRLEFARAFQGWAEWNAAQTVTEAKSEAHNNKLGKAHLLAPSGFFRFPRLAWGLAMVAVLLCAAIGLLALQNVRLHQQMIQTQARRDELLQREQELQKEIATQRSTASNTEQELARVRAERGRLEQELKNRGVQQSGEVVSLILLPPMRGTGTMPTISVHPTTASVAAQLQLEPNEYRVYHVELVDQTSHQTLWRSGQLKASRRGENKTVRAIFPAGLLKANTYAFHLSGVTATGATQVISDYPFRVVK